MTEPVTKYAGWAIAVVSAQGNVQCAYLGKIVVVEDNGGVMLHEAVELQTQLQMTPEGPRMGRAALPVMFFEGVTRVRVWPLALYPLDSLSEQDARSIDQLLEQAKTLREALRPTSGTILRPTAQAMIKLANEARNGARG